MNACIHILLLLAPLDFQPAIFDGKGNVLDYRTVEIYYTTILAQSHFFCSKIDYKLILSVLGVSDYHLSSIYHNQCIASYWYGTSI